MRSKNRFFILIAVIGIFCCGCSSSATINGNNLQDSSYSVQEITQQIAEADDSAPDMPETASSEIVSPESVIPNEPNADWQEIYYERYYAVWDSEEMMLSEIENRSIYRENCSFYDDAVYYIQGGGGEYMMKTDISYLVEPLYPTDLVYIEEEDFKDYPPLLLHLLKNEIYARHGYIFNDQDLDNYFRGLIWYTPQKGAAEFDASVFNEIEVHNLDILARLDNYICILPLSE